MASKTRIGIRWTIGDVSELGYEALRYSVYGAWRVFGEDAAYAVCVNTVPMSEARARVGLLPKEVRWVDATDRVPSWLGAHLDQSWAEGVAWKLAPPQLFPDLHELSLDNDCILWEVPQAVRDWLLDPRAAGLVAEDVRACFGQFAEACGTEPRNLGIRGLPPGFDLEAELQATLAAFPVVLRSELDEQGLQLATLRRALSVHVVALSDVTICSPFPPHRPELGRCGAHFCGLNAKHLGFRFDGRPAELCVRDHWLRHRDELRERVQRAR